MENETPRISLALDRFDEGLNCAQSVLSVYAAELGLDEAMAIRLAAALGAGLGRLQETCGAVSGGAMVLGLRHGHAKPTKEQRDEVYRLAREFTARFCERHKTIRCRDLLGVDLTTPEGKARFEAEGLRQKVCEACVATAVELLEPRGG